MIKSIVSFRLVTTITFSACVCEFFCLCVAQSRHVGMFLFLFLLVRPFIIVYGVVRFAIRETLCTSCVRHIIIIKWTPVWHRMRVDWKQNVICSGIILSSFSFSLLSVVFSWFHITTWHSCATAAAVATIHLHSLSLTHYYNSVLRIYTTIWLSKMEMACALYGSGTNDLPTYTTYWIMNAQVNEHGMAFSFYDRLTPSPPSPIVVSIVCVCVCGCSPTACSETMWRQNNLVLCASTVSLNLFVSRGIVCPSRLVWFFGGKNRDVRPHRRDTKLLNENSIECVQLDNVADTKRNINSCQQKKRIYFDIWKRYLWKNYNFLVNWNSKDKFASNFKQQTVNSDSNWHWFLHKSLLRQRMSHFRTKIVYFGIFYICPPHTQYEINPMRVWMSSYG